MTAEAFLTRVISFHFWRFWGIALSFSVTGVWLYSCISGRIVTGDDAFLTLFLSLAITFVLGFIQLLVAFTLNSSSPFNIVGHLVRLRSFPFKETSFLVGEVRSISVRAARVHPLLDLLVRRSRVSVITRGGHLSSKYFFCGPNDVNRDVERELQHDLYIAQGHYKLISLPNDGQVITYRMLPTAGLQAIFVPLLLVFTGCLASLIFHGLESLTRLGFVNCLLMWGTFIAARFVVWQFIFGQRQITVESGVARVRTIKGSREYEGVSRVRVVRGEHYASFKLFAPPTYMVVHYANEQGAGILEMRLPRAATTAQIIAIPRAVKGLLWPQSELETLAKAA